MCLQPPFAQAAVKSLSATGAGWLFICCRGQPAGPSRKRDCTPSNIRTECYSRRCPAVHATQKAACTAENTAQLEASCPTSVIGVHAGPSCELRMPPNRTAFAFVLCLFKLYLYDCSLKDREKAATPQATRVIPQAACRATRRCAAPIIPSSPALLRCSEGCVDTQSGTQTSLAQLPQQGQRDRRVLLTLTVHTAARLRLLPLNTAGARASTPSPV